MMGLSLWHLVLVAVVLFLVFGRNRLPLSKGSEDDRSIRIFKKHIGGDGA